MLPRRRAPFDLPAVTDAEDRFLPELSGPVPVGFDMAWLHDLRPVAASAAGRDAVAADAFALRRPVADPMLGQQWHLTSRTAGIDVAPAWADYSGRGVRIGIIDDGVDHGHAELARNYRTDLDRDLRDNDADAAPGPGDNHGTAVAGVIAAAAGGTGIVGVAHGAAIAGLRIGYGAAGTLGQLQGAFALASGFDVVNSSWGFGGVFTDNFWQPAFATVGRAVEAAARDGRGGLGTSLVFAAGNDRAAGQNVNYHDFQNAPYAITVGATDANGAVAAFSTPGAAILVAAPGVGILTTDRAGGAGYASGDYATVSGTSFAAPIVSGVVALMLEANPRLGYRDVQEILAYSAQKPAAFQATARTNNATDWNGGGLTFNDDLGFGLVDAQAAVRLAETWTLQSTYANAVRAYSPALATPLAIRDLGTVTSTLTILANPGYEIDRVEVGLSLLHDRIGDLVISLVSPSGTESLLVNRPGVSAATPLGSTQGMISMQLDSVQFWGEQATGAWTLKVRDAAAGATGSLLSWQLEVIGDQQDNADLYVYTDAYAQLGTQPGRSVLVDADGGRDVLNLAAVTGPVHVDLRPGGTSLVAGRPLTIAQGSVIEWIVTGDGNDRIIGNDAPNRILGGRGADTLTGGAGADVFAYQRLADAGDVITDFTARDRFDLTELLAGLGYRGKAPITDGWVKTQVRQAGTQVSVDTDGPGSLGTLERLAFLEGYRGEFSDLMLFG